MQKTKIKIGRPEAKISERQFISMCQIQCTMEEICSVFGITEKTLTAWCKKTYKKTFSQVFKQKRQGGKVSLRRMQWKAASAGNTSMLIWLGKQYLDQRDQPEVSTSDLELHIPTNIIIQAYDASISKSNDTAS